MSAVGKVLACATAALAVWGACFVYDKSLVDQPAGPDADAADTDSPTGGDAASCAHALPPQRPTVNDPDGGQIELLAAVTHVDFGFDAGGTLGFDLDRTCTCPGPESCVPQAGSLPHCDGPGGRDNSGGQLLARLAVLSSQFDPSTVNAGVMAGSSDLLFQVRGYNGAPDDGQVEVSVFVSDGTEPKNDAGTATAPKHDGNDAWSVDQTSVLAGLSAKMPYTSSYLDGNGYVAGGVLVANVDFPLQLSGGSQLLIQLKGSYVTGNLVKKGTGYGIESGVITGRWQTRQLLTSLQSAKDPLDGKQWLCGTDPTYLGLKSQICNSADVTSDIQSDNTNAPCDGISIAIGFTAEPAKLGGVEARSPAVPQCGATYTDQCGP